MKNLARMPLKQQTSDRYVTSTGGATGASLTCGGEK